MSCVISVIVPVYSDPEGIATTVAALVQQKFPKDAYEIIVSDNGSSDDTREVVRCWKEKHPDLIRLVIEDEQRSSYAARNKGIAHARGEILAFVDADVWMDPDWLAQVAERMETDDIDYLGCNVEIKRLSDSRVGHFNAIFGFPVEHYLQNTHFAPTCCLVVRKWVFQEVGLFDARLISGGDWLFGNQVHQQGIEQHFAEDITLYHPARDSLKSFVRKHFRIGRGHRQLAQYYPYVTEKRPLRVASFLPIRPGAFLGAIEPYVETENLGRVDQLVFYGLSCCKKWVQNLGYVYQGRPQGLFSVRP